MLNILKDQLIKPLSEVLRLDKDKIYSLLEVPKIYDHGHLAIPLYSLAKTLQKNPIQWAQEVSQSLSGQINSVESVTQVQGFVNFKFKAEAIKSALFMGFARSEKIGFSKSLQGQRVVIDFSSPNIAKPMHIGHLRGTVIGQALSNLAVSQGLQVIAVNHIGDWGSQFGKLAWAIENWGQEISFDHEPMQKLLELYVRFHDEAKRNPELETKGAETFKRLEKGDQNIIKIWKKIIDLSFKDYQKVYNLLGTRHDIVLGESFYNDKMDAVIKLLEQKKLLQESEGAQVVFFEENENMPPCLIKKSDGASIYATRDLAAAIYRHDEQKADSVLYVVGQEQSLHFKQVFRVLEMLGFQWVKKYHHVSYGLYKFKDGKMSTREGRVILFEDVIRKAIEMVRELIEQKNPNLENKDKVAEQIAVGAITFHDLVNDRTKNVDFEWDRILSFDGDSGPYLQYTVVRCRSLIKKHNQKIHFESLQGLESLEEQRLIFSLLQFEDVLKKSYEAYKPNILAQYLLDVSGHFSTFYHKHRILGEDQTVQQSRLALVLATERIISRGLDILNVPTPDSM